MPHRIKSNVNVAVFQKETKVVVAQQNVDIAVFDRTANVIVSDKATKVGVFNRVTNVVDLNAKPSRLQVVGATVSLTTQATGRNIRIPVPAGTQNGDLLVVVAAVPTSNFPTPPAGWTDLDKTIPGKLVQTRIAFNEPADYTWTSVDFGDSRTGCMISIRGGKSLLGEVSTMNKSTTQSVPPFTFTIPGNANNLIDDAMLVVIGATNTTAQFGVGDKFDALPPLLEKANHSHLGLGIYATLMNSAIAVEEHLHVEIIGGKILAHLKATSPTAMAIIVEPGPDDE